MLEISRSHLARLTSSLGVVAFAAAGLGATPHGATPTPQITLGRVHAKLRHIGPAPTAGSNDAGPVTGLVYNGGRVIQNVKVYQIYWTTSVNSTLVTNLDQFYQDLLGGSYMDWLSEYNTVGLNDPSGVPGSNQGIGRGSYGGAFTIANPAKCADSSTACTLLETDILTELGNQIQASAIPAPTNGCDGLPNDLYMFDFPPNITIQMLDGSTSCTGSNAWCGVHGAAQVTINGNPVTIAYGLQADGFTGPCNTGCGNDPNPLNNVTGTHAHEIIEAVTDTDVELYNQGVPGVRFAWYSNNPSGEIADLCDAAGTIPCTANCPAGQTTWTVNPGWSNIAMGCVTSMPNLPAACTGPNVPAGCRACTCADDGVACSGATPLCDTNQSDATANQCVAAPADAGTGDAGTGDASTEEAGAATDAGGGDATVGADADSGSDAGPVGANDASTQPDARTPVGLGGGNNSSGGCAIAADRNDSPALPFLVVFGAVGAFATRRRSGSPGSTRRSLRE